DAIRAAALHLDRIEARVAPDVEHRLAAQIARDGGLEPPPFEGRVVAEEMVRRGAHAAEVEVVEPRPERLDPRRDLGPRERAPRRGAQGAPSSSPAATRRASSSATSDATAGGCRRSKSVRRPEGPSRRRVYATLTRVCS